MVTIDMIEKIVEIIVNNGIGIGCILYFMYIHNSTLKTLGDAIGELRDLVKEFMLKEGLRHG